MKFTDARALTSKSQDYRPDIDGLRALAVMAVILFHTFPKVIPGGFVGVDIFFVISGYLITQIVLSDLDTGKFSAWMFYARRVRRIFPALIIVLGFTFAVGWHFLLPAELTSLGKNLLASALFSANLMLLSEVGYFDIAAHTKPLLHLWSLGIEEQFYLVWPLILWLLPRRWLVAGIIVTIVGSFAHGSYWPVPCSRKSRGKVNRQRKLWASAVCRPSLCRFSCSTRAPLSPVGLRRFR